MRPLAKIVCLFGALTTAAVPATAEEPARTITVSGEGTVSAPPDMATIHTGVVTEADMAKRALEANNEAMEKIMRVLSEHQIAQKDVQTSSFTVNPLRRHDRRRGEPPEITGYRVENQLRVRVRQLTRLGEILDALVSAGSNEISGINFGVDDPTGILNQARSRAIRNAKTRAEVYAQAAGVQLGPVRQISEQPVGIPRPMQFGMARAEAADVPVATGEQEFQVTVNVVFELAGG